MAVNKVIYYGEVLVDMSQVTVKPETLVDGVTTLDASGEMITGLNPYKLEKTNQEVSEQADLISRIQAALVGKAAGGGTGGDLPNDVKAFASGTITPTSDISTSVTVTHNLGVKPDFGLLMVDENKISDELYTSEFWTVFFYRPITLSNGNEYHGMGYKQAVNSTGSLAGNTVYDMTGTTYPATENEIKLPVFFYLKAGYTYRWCCGALDNA